MVGFSPIGPALYKKRRLGAEVQLSTTTTTKKKNEEIRTQTGKTM
jgi:hypothetical protein